MTDVRTAETLNLEEVNKYFTKLGFKVLKLEQVWRHITGKLEKDDKQYFLKLASTEDIGRKTKNEYKWNLLVNKLPTAGKLPCKVPDVLREGYYGKLYWFLVDYVEGEPIILPIQSSLGDKLSLHLDFFAETVLGIIRLKLGESLPNDAHCSFEEEKEKLIVNINKWADESQADIKDLVSKTIGNIDKVLIAPMHGDFVPWHVIQKTNGEIFLIDGEHARTKGIKFYDLAHFYLRVYTKLKRPDIADAFLKKFKDIYTFRLEDKECFNFILGQRLIGGYFDAKYDDLTDLSLLNELKVRLLADQIL